MRRAKPAIDTHSGALEGGEEDGRSLTQLMTLADGVWISPNQKMTSYYEFEEKDSAIPERMTEYAWP